MLHLFQNILECRCFGTRNLERQIFGENPEGIGELGITPTIELTAHRDAGTARHSRQKDLPACQQKVRQRCVRWQGTLGQFDLLRHDVRCKTARGTCLRTPRARTRAPRSLPCGSSHARSRVPLLVSSLASNSCCHSATSAYCMTSSVACKPPAYVSPISFTRFWSPRRVGAERRKTKCQKHASVVPRWPAQHGALALSRGRTRVR